MRAQHVCKNGWSIHHFHPKIMNGKAGAVSCMKVGVPMDAIFPCMVYAVPGRPFPSFPSLEIPAFVKLKGHLISLNGNLAAHRVWLML